MNNEEFFNTDEIMIQAGARLRSVRESLKMSQTQFAAILKVSQSKVAQCEIGAIMIQSDVLVMLYKTAGINPLWILLGEGDRSTKKKPATNSTNFDAEVDRSILKMQTLQMKEVIRRVKELEIEVLLLKNSEK